VPFGVGAATLTEEGRHAGACIWLAWGIHGRLIPDPHGVVGISIALFTWTVPTTRCGVCTIPNVIREAFRCKPQLIGTARGSKIERDGAVRVEPPEGIK